MRAFKPDKWCAHLSAVLCGALMAVVLPEPAVVAQTVRIWTVESGGNGYAYELVNESLTWQAAAEKAIARTPPPGFSTGNLASILSSAENSFLGSWSGWIGFTDQALEGEWRWNDGTPGVWQDPQFFPSPVQSLYTRWRSGEPNNWNGNQDFAIFNGGTWDDGSDAPYTSYIVKYVPGLIWAPNAGAADEWTPTGSSWLSGTSRVAWVPDSIATFSGTGGNVKVQGNMSIKGLLFSTQGYVLEGGTLSLYGSQASIQVLAPATITSVMSGSSQMGIYGSSLLTLTGSHTYSGGTLVSSGTLRLGDGSAANGSVTGNILNNSRLEFANPGSQTYAGSISGTGSVLKTGAGVLVLTGSNTYTGTTSLREGALQLGDDSTTNGTVSGAILVDAELRFANPFTQAYSGTISGTGVIQKIGNGVLQLTGSSPFSGTTTVSQGAIQLGDGTTTNGSLAGPIVVSSELRFATVLSQTYSKLISGTGTVEKTGVGTLTLTGSSPFVGTTTVSQGTLQFGDGVTTNGSVAGPINAAGAVIFSTRVSQTYAGFISGSGSLTKQGPGMLTLTASNSFTGTTTVSQGHLSLGDGVTANGAVAGNIVNNALLTFSNPKSQTFGGSISGTGSVLKTGSGALLLTGSNNYSGVTHAMFGTLVVGGSSAVSPSSILVAGTQSGSYTSVDLNGFSVVIPGLSGPGGVHLNGGTLTVSNTGSHTYAGSFTGTGAVVKQSAGALTLTGTSAFAGQTIVSSGTLRLGDGVNSGGLITGNIQNNARLEFASPFSETYSGTISGTGQVTKTASGALVILGDQMITGTTTVSQGLLQLGNGTTANGSVSGPIVANSQLRFANPADQAFAGSISGTGSISKTGAGALILTGTSSFSGTTTISQGALQLGDATAQNGAIAGSIRNDASLIFANVTSQTFNGVISGPGGVTKIGIGQFTLTGSQALSGDIVVNEGVLRFGNGTSLNGTVSANITNNATLSFANPFTQTYSGTITGDGSLLKAGSGTLIFARAQPYSGVTTVSTGVLQLGDGVTGNVGLGGDVSVSSSGTLAFNNPASQSFAYEVSGAGGLTKSGSGALTLLGVNTYAGPTTINEGILRLGAGGALPSNTRLILSNTANAVFDINNQSQRVGSLSGGSRSEIILRAGELTVSQTSAGTFGGTISGNNGSLVKIGSQTLTLTNTNTYTGLTTVSGGVLRLGNGVSGGSIAGNLRSDAETVFANPTTQAYAGSISGTGILTKAGEGTLILTGSSSFTGLTRVNEGVLQLGNGSSRGSLLGSIVNNTAVVIDANDPQTLDAVIEGLGSITKRGTGTLTLSGSSAHTGATTIAAGILAFGTSGGLASSLIEIAPAAGLDVRALGDGLSLTGVRTLAGSGTVFGSVVFGQGSTLSPGAASTSTVLGGLSAAYANTEVTLSPYAVPEPTGIALLASAGSFAGLSVIRRGCLRRGKHRDFHVLRPRHEGDRRRNHLGLFG